MRKIIKLRIDDPVPDNARPIGVVVEKFKYSSSEVIDVAWAYYDIPDEEKKDVPTKRR